MKRLLSVILTLCLLLAFAGCGGGTPGGEEQPQRHDEIVMAMDTAMALSAYGEAASAALAACKDEILRLDALFSATDESGDIERINSAAGEFVSVEPETIEVLKLALEYAALTAGAFDPTVYGLVRLYGFTTDSYRVAGSAEIEHALASVGYENIEVNGDRARVLNGAKIDLGGIAKGYLADRLVGILREYGVESAILTLGGNVISVGLKPDGSEWVVGLADPKSPDQSCLSLATELSVVTSGSYQRYFVGDDGQLYHHIIDPATGYPARNGLTSVTIVCADSAKADALSTALFVMGLERGLAFWRETGGFEAIFIDEAGVVTATPGVAGELRLLNSAYTLVTAE